MMHYVKTGMIAVAAVIIVKAVLGAVAPAWRDYV
jgi:hypothetical protein